MANCTRCLITTLMLTFAFLPWNVQSTRPNYYQSSCPNAEIIVRSIVEAAINRNRAVAPAILRMFFHDCFVEGCDGSILIDSPSNNAEKYARSNQNIVGYEVIDQVKAALEGICNKTVSCADILAFAASTSVAAAGGPTVDLQGGRFDGLVSSEAEADAQLPSEFNTLPQLESIFSSKGLSVTDLVVLSGSHTIGQAHCQRVLPRIRNFSSTANVDPRLNPAFAKYLMRRCPATPSPNTVLPMDTTPTSFDNTYYQKLRSGNVLFESDADLYTNGLTQQIVDDFAAHSSHFLSSYGPSLFKMGQIGLKSSANGNIRTNCRSFA